MIITKERDAFFDNAKFILILFVVIGHTIQNFINTENFSNLKALYLWIYSFHMPLFVLITGLFAKKLTNTQWRRQKIINYICLYIVFSLLHFAIISALSAWNSPIHPSALSLLKNLFDHLKRPNGALWFLASMAAWYYITPYITRHIPNIRVCIIVLFILSLLSGYISFIGRDLSLSRTIVFYPFFLLGYHLQPSYFKNLRFPIAVSTILICLIGWALYEFSPDINYRWLYGAQTYRSLGHTEWYAFVYRIGVYILWCVMSFLILAVIPKKKTFFTTLGTSTLYVYLLHQFVYQYMIYLPIERYLSTYLTEILLVLFAAAYCFILSSEYVAKVFKFIIDFDYYSFIESRKKNT